MTLGPTTIEDERNMLARLAEMPAEKRNDIRTWGHFRRLGMRLSTIKRCAPYTVVREIEEIEYRRVAERRAEQAQHGTLRLVKKRTDADPPKGDAEIRAWIERGLERLRDRRAREARGEYVPWPAMPGSDPSPYDYELVREMPDGSLVPDSPRPETGKGGGPQPQCTPAPVQRPTPPPKLQPSAPRVFHRYAPTEHDVEREEAGEAA